MRPLWARGGVRLFTSGSARVREKGGPSVGRDSRGYLRSKRRKREMKELCLAYCLGGSHCFYEEHLRKSERKGVSLNNWKDRNLRGLRERAERSNVRSGSTY